MTKTFLLSFFLVFLGCETDLSPKLIQFEGQTMGTTYTVKVFSDSTIDRKQISNKIDKTLGEVSRQMSTYDEDSEISKVNGSKASEIPIGPWFAKVLKKSLEIAERTDGGFDPTVGPLVNLWGFGPRKHREIPSEAKIKSTKLYVGYKKVKVFERAGKHFVRKTHDRIYLDLSGSAKGFGVDAVSEMLRAEGFKDHLVEIGGELRASGRKPSGPWRIAIERPEAGQRSVESTIVLNGLSVATSGSYRNFTESGGKTYSHTLDQTTGKPVAHNLVSVTVLGRECLEADAWATALMVMGPQKAFAFAQENQLPAYFIIGPENQETGGKKIKPFEKSDDVKGGKFGILMTDSFKEMTRFSETRGEKR